MAQCDHGHAIFDDGTEVEFGWTDPSERDLEQCVKDGIATDKKDALLRFAKHCACAWASGVKTYTPDMIKRIWLAG